MVDVLQFVKLRYRPDAIQWEYPQLVTDLSRSTAAIALIVARCSSSTMCSPPWDYGERKMPAQPC